jgi:uncharacterized SAM-binding protein YcdF (DUF218 family)
MFFFLSKTIYYVAMPVVWLTGLLLLAALTKQPKRRRAAVKIAAVVLLFFTNPFIYNEALLAWELAPQSLAGLPAHDAGIILTGITERRKSPHDRVYLEKGADRVIHALWLYRAKKIRTIIISGGSGSFRPGYSTEATELKKILLLAGVPPAAILVEDKSRNTRENALFTAQLIKQHPKLQSFVLITSAFHMRRSRACFNKVGVPVTVFPVDYYSVDRSFYPTDLIIPSDKTFAGWHVLLREIIGYITYRLVGYAS